MLVLKTIYTHTTIYTHITIYGVSKKNAMEIQQAIVHHHENFAKQFNFYIGRKSCVI
jgi:hypothetical protein